MKFATTTFAAILLVAAVVGGTNAAASYSLPTVRGGISRTTPREEEEEQGRPSLRAAWSTTTHDETHHRRRHLEHGNSDCLLVLKDIQYEDHEIEEDNMWACEFSYEVAMNDLNGRSFIDIVDVPKDVIDNMGAVSGASILKTTGAYIEESLDDDTYNEMKLHIPEDAEMEVVTLRETDQRHYKQRRMNVGMNGNGDRSLRSSGLSSQSQSQSQRTLADSTGTLSVLVIRVVDAANAQIDATNTELKGDIFTDEFSLGTGYAQCSHNQLIMEPATGDNRISDGIITVNIDITAVPNNERALQDAVLDKATEDYGDLPSQYDLVMVCQPPGTGRWVAYAYINSYVSFYNDYWCQKVSAQMHEVGHNLGLGHSNQDEVAYGDQSSLMGFSYGSDDGPKMCFNAAKNFQLGWYENAKQSFYPLEYKNSVQNFVLNGVDDYQKEGTTNGELITLRLVEFGDEYNFDVNAYGNDYYIGYNRQTGINSGTVEAPNQVVIFRKDSGGPDEYGESNRIADLNPGEQHTIRNFKGTIFDVTIFVKPFLNNGRDAPIEISVVGDGVPTESPTESCGSSGPAGRFQVELNIDRYSYETSWELIDNDSNSVIESAPKEDHLGRTRYNYPNDGNKYYCLEESCYTFKITDSYGDGFFNGEGNFRLYIDNQLKHEGGGADNFQTEESYVFCVGGDNNDQTQPPTRSPTKFPTNFPTHFPTKSPTKSPTPEPTEQTPSRGECENGFDNGDDYRFRNDPSKDCDQWVAEYPTTRCGKIDTKNEQLLVSYYCPIQCIDKCSPTTTSPTVFDDVDVDVNCDNNNSYAFKNLQKFEQYCEQLENINNTKQLARKCGKTDPKNNNKEVSEFCPGVCKDECK